LPSLDEKRFRKAFEFAEEAHRGQIRKDGETPYIAHPVAAVEILVSLKADEDTLISALLHDVPEDTDKTLKEIGEMFGDKVEFLVDGITKLSKVQYQKNMPDRQVESLKKLLLHSAKDIRVIIIKLADRLHNMTTLGNIDNAEKRLRIATETLEIYVPIANLLGIRELKSRLEDMCFKFMFPSEYNNLKKKIDSGREKRKKYVARFIEVIEKEAEKNKIKIGVYEREKNLYSIYKSLCALGKTVDSVDDRVGIVVIVESIKDCYQILGLIHLKFAPLTKKFKDYIANPKGNGYQSLHTNVFGVDGVSTEVQIRTKEMDIEADFGMAINFLGGYSADKAPSGHTNDSKWLKNVVKISEDKEVSENFIEDLKLDVLQDRIVVLTPRGRPVDLPKGACVIDFAYAIHTNLGNHAQKAELNGKLVPITSTLETRDVVKIITSKEVSPDLSWLHFVKTNLAKTKILSYLKKISKVAKISKGKELLQTELDILHMGLVTNLGLKKLNKGLVVSTGKLFVSLNEIFEAIGEGKIGTFQVIEALGNDAVNGESGGKWISIKVVAKNRFRLMQDVYEVLYKYANDMNTFKGWVSKNADMAYFISDVLVKNSKHISKIFHELNRVEGVISVTKTSRRGLWLSVALGSFLALVWIIHPVLIRMSTQSPFGGQFPNLVQNTIYFGLFLMFGALIFYVKLIGKFFPLARKKRSLWFVVFLLPIIATSMLAVEILYFDLMLSWWVIFIEMIFMYLYIGINYADFSRFREDRD